MDTEIFNGDSIVRVTDYYVVTDRFARIKKGGLYLLWQNGLPEDDSRNYAKVATCESEFHADSINVFKSKYEVPIIATINRRLDGVPLIELQSKEFDLDAEITKLNTPERYDSAKNRYNYSEKDITALFDKATKANKNPYARISDELGNPIDAIDTWLQLYSESIKTPPESNEYLSQINTLVEKMKEILNRYRNMDYSTAAEYTYEDMITALGYMTYEMNTNGMGACSVSHHKAKSFWPTIKQQLLLCKNGKPVSVELEYEEMACEEIAGKTMNNERASRLVITNPEENTIIPVNVIYK